MLSKEAVEKIPFLACQSNQVKPQKCCVANDKNRYVIVLYGLKANSLDSKRLLQGIREAFQEEYIKKEIIDKFVASSGEIVYTKTKDKKHVARMNKSIETVGYFMDLLQNDSIYQNALCKKVGRYLVGRGKDGYIRPNEVLYQDLQDFTGENIFSCRSTAQNSPWTFLSSTMSAPSGGSAAYEFYGLHRVLQKLFGWWDYHLHEFMSTRMRR